MWGSLLVTGMCGEGFGGIWMCVILIADVWDACMTDEGIVEGTSRRLGVERRVYKGALRILFCKGESHEKVEKWAKTAMSFLGLSSVS